MHQLIINDLLFFTIELMLVTNFSIDFLTFYSKTVLFLPDFRADKCSLSYYSKDFYYFQLKTIFLIT